MASASASKASAQTTNEEMELSKISSYKYLNSDEERAAKREEILDRIIDIVISIKRLNIQLEVDYHSITNKLIHNFNKITVFNLIETMKRDSRLKAHAPLYKTIQNYSNDIMDHLDLIYV